MLDDISFQKDPADAQANSNANAVEQNRPLKPFSKGFLWSLAMYRPKRLEELTVLVLPPLTARPNPIVHRLDIVDECLHAGTTKEMERFLADQLRERAEATINRGRTPNTMWNPLGVRVRYATCSLWPSNPWHGSPENHAARSAEFYVERKCYKDSKLKLNEANPAGSLFNFRDLYCGKQALQAIQKDMEALSRPFCRDIGLGPHLLWESSNRGRCGTGRAESGIVYRVASHWLWTKGGAAAHVVDKRRGRLSVWAPSFGTKGPGESTEWRENEVPKRIAVELLSNNGLNLHYSGAP